MQVCPICRVYDPVRFVHYEDCPFFRFHRGIMNVSLIAALYRRHPVFVDKIFSD